VPNNTLHVRSDLSRVTGPHELGFIMPRPKCCTSVIHVFMIVMVPMAYECDL